MDFEVHTALFAWFTSPEPRKSYAGIWIHGGNGVVCGILVREAHCE